MAGGVNFVQNQFMFRLIIFIVILLGLQFYAFQSVRAVTKSSVIYWIYWGVVSFVLLNLVYHFAIVAGNSRVLTPSKSYAIGFFTTLLVFNLVIVIIVLGEDIYRLIAGTVSKIRGTSTNGFLPERRKLISQIALGIAAIPFTSMIYGMVKGKYNFRVIKHVLTFKDLPEEFDGYKITQISDIHSGSFDNKEKIEYAVDMINDQKSDAIFFTGDLVNNEATEMLPWMQTFGRMKAKDGVFSILGNHDYGDYVSWESDEAKEKNMDMLKNIQKEMGFDLLLNEHRYLRRGDAKIAIVGVENWGIGGFKKAGDLKKARKDINDKDFTILMSHDPSHWEAEVLDDSKQFHLTLSGHTHGMQFGIEIPGWIKWSPIQWKYKQWAGIYNQKDQYLHINRGLGYLAFPGRVGIWPEITVIELKRG